MNSELMFYFDFHFHKKNTNVRNYLKTGKDTLKRLFLFPFRLYHNLLNLNCVTRNRYRTPHNGLFPVVYVSIIYIPAIRLSQW